MPSILTVKIRKTKSFPLACLLCSRSFCIDMFEDFGEALGDAEEESAEHRGILQAGVERFGAFFADQDSFCG